MGDLPLPFPPLGALDNRPNNLPVQRTSLIGREREIEMALERLLRADVSLLTLTGPGGTGKTRLALQVAADALDYFADGVFFVPLGAISDPELVLPTAAQTLGLREAGERPLAERLREHLKHKQVLLLLDNFEQVVAAAPRVSELLAACPRLKLLVTSRAVLRVYGEHDFPVPPLSLPDPTRPPSLDRLAEYGAIALFLERAQAADPTFVLTQTNGPAVAEICRRVDGLPLAIELAAARVRLLPPTALLARLERRLSLLTGGAQDAPTRQQTLRRTMEWSHELLDADEQRLFHRLAVFVGGCTLESAEAVCNAVDPAQLEVLDGAGSLIDKSLVRGVEQSGADGQPAPRLWMLETVREYGLERLAASGEEEPIRRAHGDHYLALAEAAEAHLLGAHMGAWVARVEAEHDNLRAALRWLLDRGEGEAALRLAAPLWRFWLHQGYQTEGRRWLTDALAATEAVASPTRAKALSAAGIIAHYQGDYGRAASLCGEALHLSRLLDDKPGITQAIHGLALVARTGGDYAAARAMYDEALAMVRASGDRWNIAYTVQYLGVAIWMQGEERPGDFAATRPLFEEALAIYQELNYQPGIAACYSLLGAAALSEGDLASARQLCDRAVAIAAQVGNRRDLARAVRHSARLALREGDFAAARTHDEREMAINLELGDRWQAAAFLEHIAEIAIAAGQPRSAARLGGAAEALRDAIGAPLPGFQRMGHQRIVAGNRAALGDEAFAAAWAEGRAMTPQEAIAAEPLLVAGHAPVEDLPARVSSYRGDAGVSRPLGPHRSSASAGLTGRELEVLRLVAEGLTNAQVAARLVVSPRTVNAHLGAIYGKLGVASRTAAVRYAVDHQMV